MYRITEAHKIKYFLISVIKVPYETFIQRPHRFLLLNRMLRFYEESFEIPHKHQGIESFKVLFRTFCRKECCIPMLREIMSAC